MNGSFFMLMRKIWTKEHIDRYFADCEDIDYCRNNRGVAIMMPHSQYKLHGTATITGTVTDWYNGYCVTETEPIDAELDFDAMYSFSIEIWEKQPGNIMLLALTYEQMDFPKNERLV